MVPYQPNPCEFGKLQQQKKAIGLDQYIIGHIGIFCFSKNFIIQLVSNTEITQWLSIKFNDFNLIPLILYHKKEWINVTTRTWLPGNNNSAYYILGSKTFGIHK